MLRNLTSREKFWIALALALFCLWAFDYRTVQDASAREKSDANLFKELKTFTDVLAIVERDYVRPIENKQVIEGAIKGMLSTLDPHSGYLDPDFYQDLQVQTKGEFGGLGIEITIKEGLLVVVAPMEGSPAEKAGIKAGDAIVKIDGKFTKEFSLVDAVKKLRGPKGSPINISVQRKGARDLIDVTVIRDNILVKSVRSRYLGDRFGYARVSQFMEKTSDDLKSALKRMTEQTEGKQLRGLILDMRNNPGGLLTQAFTVSDLFLTSGVIVYTDGRVEHQKQKFYAHARDTEPDYPIIVLVNGGSASASEIVAGALKDHGRGLILGTQTFGKGSVQTITPLENGGALTLTTALYYTKSGRSLQALGVTPDIIYESEEERQEKADEEVRPSRIHMREGDLPGAITNPTERQGGEDDNAMRKINKTPTVRNDLSTINPEKEDLQTWLKRDRQLQRALDLLKTFNIFKGGAAAQTQAVKEAADKEAATKEAAEKEGAR